MIINQPFAIKICQYFKIPLQTFYTVGTFLLILMSILSNQASSDMALDVKPRLSKFYGHLIQRQCQRESDAHTAKKVHGRENNELMEIELIDYDLVKTLKKPKRLQEKEENFIWKDKPIQIRNLDHVRINRARLHDWFIEVCAAFNQSWRTLWAAIAFLDKIIIEKGHVRVQNIHIYGITVLFMASKYHQHSKNQLSLQNITENICHKKFTIQQILNCETDVFIWVCNKGKTRNLQFQTMQDRIGQCFDGLDDSQTRNIMIELLYFWQDPTIVLNEETNFTEKTLVKKVGEKILENKRFPGCQKIEEFFLNEYGCKNIKELSSKLRI